MLHGHQVVPCRPMLPIGWIRRPSGEFSPFYIDKPGKLTRDGNNKVQTFERFPIVKQTSLPLVDANVRYPIVAQIRLERRLVMVVEKHLLENEK